MRNQQLLIILMLGALLRNIIPTVDIFMVTLVLLLLMYPDSMSLTAIFATIAAFLASLLLDAPIGLFPLILSLYLFVFGTFQFKSAQKGIGPLVYWTCFAILTIVTETFVRVILTTGRLQLPLGTQYQILATISLILVLSFIFSFKRKL